MLFNRNDAISLEFFKNDRDVPARPFDSWNPLEFYINPGHIWARHGRSLMSEKRAFPNDPCERLPKAVAVLVTKAVIG